MEEAARSERRRLVHAPEITEVMLFGLLPLGLFAWVVGSSAIHHLSAYGLEFRGNLWLPGKLILAGHSPYQPHRLDAMLAAVQSGHVPPDLPARAQAVYPAPTHVLAAPFALLPFELGMGLFVALSLLALFGTLWILDVRDWRCYGVAFLSLAVIQGIKLGGITPFLALALALLWRFRDRRAVVSLPTAAMVVGKLFLWPMALWLLATRRRAAFARSAVLTVLVLTGGWAVIGFRGLTGYPHLLSVLASLEEARGDSFVSIGISLGLTTAEARGVALAAGVILLAAMVALARRGQDRESFVLALAAAFMLTPIVWLQYFMLVLVPIAMFRPRLSPAWGIPLLLWLAPNDGVVHPSAYQLLVHQGVLALTVGFALSTAVRAPVTSGRLRHASAAPQAVD